MRSNCTPKELQLQQVVIMCMCFVTCGFDASMNFLASFWAVFLVTEDCRNQVSLIKLYYRKAVDRQPAHRNDKQACSCTQPRSRTVLACQVWCSIQSFPLIPFLSRQQCTRTHSTQSNVIITSVKRCSAWLQCPLALSGLKHHSKTTLPYLLTSQMMSQAD